MLFRSHKLIGFLSAVLFVFFMTPQVFAAGTAGSGRAAKAMSYSSGNSGFLFDTAIYYGQSEAVGNPSANNQWKDNTSIYDIKLGYIMTEGVYLGAEYSTRNQSTTSTNVNATTGSATAAGLGYFFNNGFSLRAFYRMNETFGDYSSGSGFQADLGYMLTMSSNFNIGFAVSHRQVTFATNKTISQFDYWTKKETFPFLTFGFLIR